MRIKLSTLLIGIGLGFTLTSIGAASKIVAYVSSLPNQVFVGSSGNPVFDTTHTARVKELEREPKAFEHFHCAREYEGYASEVRDFYQSRNQSVGVSPKSESCDS